jgi:hypothetical protein
MGKYKHLISLVTFVVVSGTCECHETTEDRSDFNSRRPSQISHLTSILNNVTDVLIVHSCLINVTRKSIKILMYTFKLKLNIKVKVKLSLCFN